jgi:hypothetical protein
MFFLSILLVYAYKNTTEVEELGHETAAKRYAKRQKSENLLSGNDILVQSNKGLNIIFSLSSTNHVFPFIIYFLLNGRTSLSYAAVEETYSTSNKLNYHLSNIYL